MRQNLIVFTAAWLLYASPKCMVCSQVDGLESMQLQPTPQAELIEAVRAAGRVRKTPCRPRSWVNFSFL